MRGLAQELDGAKLRRQPEPTVADGACQRDLAPFGALGARWDRSALGPTHSWHVGVEEQGMHTLETGKTTAGSRPRGRGTLASSIYERRAGILRTAAIDCGPEPLVCTLRVDANKFSRFYLGPVNAPGGDRGRHAQGRGRSARFDTRGAHR